MQRIKAKDCFPLSYPAILQFSKLSKGEVALVPFTYLSLPPSSATHPPTPNPHPSHTLESSTAPY